MELISSIPYYDTGIENPATAEFVRSLISDEMKLFKPNPNCLKHLPYPASKLPPATQAELARISSGIPRKFDSRRYSVEGPDSSLENDIQSWKSAISNAKSQYEHRTNHLMNLELSEATMGPETVGNLSRVWLAGNAQTEALAKAYQQRALLLKKRVDEIHAQRQLAQTKAGQELERLRVQRETAIKGAWQAGAGVRLLGERSPLSEEQRVQIMQEMEREEEEEREREQGSEEDDEEKEGSEENNLEMQQEEEESESPSTSHFSPMKRKIDASFDETQSKLPREIEID